MQPQVFWPQLTGGRTSIGTQVISLSMPIYIYTYIYICSMYGIFTYIWLKFVYNYVQQGGGFQPFFMFTSTCGKFPFWQIKNWTGWNHNMYMSFYISESFSWHHGAESYVVRERKLIRQNHIHILKFAGDFQVGDILIISSCNVSFEYIMYYRFYWSWSTYML